MGRYAAKAPIEKIKNTFTDSDIKEFGKWLEKFREGKHAPNIKEAMVEYGAMSKFTHAGVMTYSVRSISKYEEFGEKMDALSKKNERREYAQMKANEEIAALADQKTIHG
jgi:UDP-N-acetylmuramyl pentapeptide synthase